MMHDLTLICIIAPVSYTHLGVERKYVEEVGTMNVMFKIDNKIVTAPCDGTVLPGVTRDSILQLLTSWGYEVEERHLAIDELMQAGKEGRLEEAFGTGTAAVISPVGELNFKGEITVINDFKTGDLTQKQMCIRDRGVTYET